MTTREHAIDLVSRLSPQDLDAITPVLERLAGRLPQTPDEIQAAWDAMPPADDEEPLSGEDWRAIEESRARRARGEAGVPHEEVHQRVQEALRHGEGE